jgi:phage terminase large subunit-like protein
MPKLDPVTRYATDVRDGKIVASRLVRLACDRHLRDLSQQAEKGLEWRPQAAQDVIDFFAEVLCLPEDTNSGEALDEDAPPSDGTPFVLSPWQQFIVGSLFGWYASTGFRRFRVAYIEVSKGAGKTPMFAGCLLYMLVADGERGAQLFCAAVTKDQAKLAFTDCERMVQASPHLKALIDQKVNNLAVLETGSFIRPISAEKRGLDGKRVHGAIIDEEHEHPNDTVYLKIRAGTKGRRNALIFIPTNSGFDQETVCWRHHDFSRQVLTGEVANETWFAFVAHLDSCEACYALASCNPRTIVLIVTTGKPKARTG